MKKNRTKRDITKFTVRNTHKRREKNKMRDELIGVEVNLPEKVFFEVKENMFLNPNISIDNYNFTTIQNLMYDTNNFEVLDSVEVINE